MEWDETAEKVYQIIKKATIEAYRDEKEAHLFAEGLVKTLHEEGVVFEIADRSGFDKYLKKVG